MASSSWLVKLHRRALLVSYVSSLNHFSLFSLFLSCLLALYFQASFLYPEVLLSPSFLFALLLPAVLFFPPLQPLSLLQDALLVSIIIPLPLPVFSATLIFRSLRLFIFKFTLRTPGQCTTLPTGSFITQILCPIS